MLRLLQAFLLAGFVATPALAWEPDEDEAREEEGEAEIRLMAEVADARLPAPRIGVTETRAGARVRARWKRLPAAVEELELVLSLDGGRTWSLRVSRELHADRTETSWEVPNLATADARLRIRARIGGRETWGPEGRPFRIAADPSRPRERWLFWESPRADQVAGEHGARPGLATPSADSSLHAAHASAAVEPPARSLVEPPALATRGVPSSPSPRPCAARPRASAFAERVAPLRN